MPYLRNMILFPRLHQDCYVWFEIVFDQHILHVKKVQKKPDWSIVYFVESKAFIFHRWHAKTSFSFLACSIRYTNDLYFLPPENRSRLWNRVWPIHVRKWKDTWGSKLSVSRMLSALISLWIIRLWQFSWRYIRPAAVPRTILYLTAQSSFSLEPGKSKYMPINQKQKMLEKQEEKKLQTNHEEVILSSREEITEEQDMFHLQLQTQLILQYCDDLHEQ